jgi:hypothetical protein
MFRISAVAMMAYASCLACAAAQTAERHVVGLTEGRAHRKADAQCGTSGERARVHMFLNNGLAFECYDPATGVGDDPPGLTFGPL